MGRRMPGLELAGRRPRGRTKLRFENVLKRNENKTKLVSVVRTTQRTGLDGGC